MVTSIKKGVVAIVMITLATVGAVWLYFHNPEHEPLAPKCVFWKYTGWRCPGCGSQRAIYWTLHGEFEKAFKTNALFYPALLYLAVYGLSLKQHWVRMYNNLTSQFALYTFTVVIIAFTILRNVFEF